MAIESYLIKLNEQVSREDVARVITYINENGGRIASVIRNGSVIIGAFENYLADEVRRLPSVKLVGGVVFKDKIPVIRRLHK